MVLSDFDVQLNYDSEEEMFTGCESEPAYVPGLQVPERWIIAGPRVGRFRCCHKRVVLHELLGVAYQADTPTNTHTHRQHRAQMMEEVRGTACGKCTDEKFNSNILTSCSKRFCRLPDNCDWKVFRIKLEINKLCR